MYRTLATMSAVAILATACNTTQRIVSIAPETLKVKLTITDRIEAACTVPEFKTGDDKVSVIAKMIVEIKDCESKRAAAVAVITQENTKREADNKQALAKLQP